LLACPPKIRPWSDRSSLQNWANIVLATKPKAAVEVQTKVN
jgi:hypothetical protein